MFAYCQSNPVNYKDLSGFLLVGAVQNTRDGFQRESGSAGISADALSSLLKYVSLTSIIAQTMYVTATKDEETVQVDVSAVTTTSPETSLYYPADYVGDSTGKKEWRVYPNAMDYNTAIAWVISMASSGRYGKNASWGLYTEDPQDAYDMAAALCGAIPCLHANRNGEYPHYHAAGMILFGEYKHFHVWYGEKCTE